MIKYTEASNLRELNRYSQYKVEYAGFYMDSEGYPYPKTRAYHFAGDDFYFGIAYNSDRESFETKDEHMYYLRCNDILK